MTSSPRNQSAARSVTRRKFPSVLLAVTKNDERRSALLALTRERFVVTDCGIGHDVAQLWSHPRKFDALLVMFDESLDPTCPLVIGDIRRRELQDTRQDAASVFATQQSRLGEGDSVPITAHRAQRFAERQHEKLALIEAQRMIGLVSSSTSTITSPSSGPRQKTLIIGFCEAGRIAEKSAMDHSGQYDVVRVGLPSDPNNVEYLTDLLRADYTLPLPSQVPTFEEVVATLAKFRLEAHGHSGTQGWDKLNSSVVSTGALGRSTLASSGVGSPLGSPVGRSGASSMGPLSDQWQALLNTGVSSPKSASNAAKLSFERQLREAKERIVELTAARDSLDHDLATAHATNHQLRATVDTIQEELQTSRDKYDSVQTRYESLAKELDDVRLEAAIQCRQSGSATGGPTFSHSGPTPALNEDVQHLVLQNNRLRQTSFEYETALHEKTLECKALQRRLRKIISGGGSASNAVGAGTIGRAQRHPSLCRVQLPDAMDLFQGAADDSPFQVPALLDIGTKLEAEMASDGEEETSSSGTSSASGRGGNSKIAAQRSVRFTRGTSLVRSKSSGGLRRRSNNANGADTSLSRESMERSLMAFYDCESRQDALFAGLSDWMHRGSNQMPLTSALLMRPQTSHSSDDSHGATISSTWAVVDQQLRQSNRERIEMIKELTAANLVFGTQPPSSLSELAATRALLTDNGVSDVAAQDVVKSVGVICKEVCHFVEQVSGIHRAVLQNFLASHLQFYDHMSLRLRSMADEQALPSLRALLNATVSQQCASAKKALIQHTAADKSTIELGRRAVVRSVAQIGAVAGPLRLQLENVQGSLSPRSVDSATQTSDRARPRPPTSTTRV